MSHGEAVNWNCKWFGIWKDAGPLSECPSVDDFIDDAYRLEDHVCIVDFLARSPTVAIFGAKHQCLCCEMQLPIGYKSDGTLLWTIGLHHYVDTHSVVVPQIFVEHIRQLDYRVPEDCDVALEELPWPVGQIDRPAK